MRALRPAALTDPAVGPFGRTMASDARRSNNSLVVAVVVHAVVAVALAQRAAAQPAPAHGGDPAQTADDRSKAAAATAAPAPSSDDLARAADATAAVADLSSASPPAKASADDIDLSTLGLDPSAAAFDDKLSIYGFADISWTNQHLTKHNPFLKDATGFTIGSLNVYVAKNLTPRWRSLAEVRFMYLPNGSPNPDGTVQTTTAGDSANFGRPTQWGTISIERAYIEYDLHPRLTLRIGHWLTPYGIWNTDHGSPVIIGVFRPYLVGDAVFPEHQTGLDLFGAAPVGDYKISYHATMSNGRSPTEMVADTDRKPAFGGRLELEGSWAGTVKLGVSGYVGHFTDATTSTTVPPVAFDERAFAADAQWDHGGLHLQAEVLTRHKAYVDGTRPFTLLGTPQSDGNDFGAYGLIGYRFNQLWNVMPFAFYEDYRALVTGPIGDAKAGHVGLNFRPAPTVVLKLHGAYAWGDGTGLIKSDVYILTSQIAWVF